MISRDRCAQVCRQGDGAHHDSPADGLTGEGRVRGEGRSRYENLIKRVSVRWGISNAVREGDKGIR